MTPKLITYRIQGVVHWSSFCTDYSHFEALASYSSRVTTWCHLQAWKTPGFYERGSLYTIGAVDSTLFTLDGTDEQYRHEFVTCVMCSSHDGSRREV
jgi:hypothetical protein